MKKPEPQPDRPMKDAHHAVALYSQVAPLLAGKPSNQQGNAIAMLLGQWLAGHRALKKDGSIDLEKTREIRSNLMVLTTNAGFAYAADLDQQRSSKEAEDGPGRSAKN
jgi:hypothetical protein